jgi:transposase-like protein
LPDPPLVVSDGAPGLIRAIEECFPRSVRQRCLAHKLRNLQSNVPEDQWPEFKPRAIACYQAASPARVDEQRALKAPTPNPPTQGLPRDFGARSAGTETH